MARSFAPQPIIGIVVLLGTAIGGAVACEGRDPPRGPSPLGVGGGNFVTAISSGPSGTGGSEDIVPDPEAPCDAGIDFDTSDPVEGAAALGICKRAADADDWGLISARWAMADGSDAINDPDYRLGHGVLDRFGTHDPQEGERFVALSSGTARRPGQVGYEPVVGFDKEYISPTPSGYPKESPACPGVTTGQTHDDVALEVIMRSPPGAEALAFDFNFFTYEWPDFVCSEFNDFFLAFLEPIVAGQADPNISFDSVGNVVSVNNALVRVCDCSLGPPCEAPPEIGLISYDCDEGATDLELTGFEGRAATSWLVTTAPVEADEELKLRFTIYDSGDGVLDSTVIIDNFRWRGEGPTNPITDPK